MRTDSTFDRSCDLCVQADRCWTTTAEAGEDGDGGHASLLIDRNDLFDTIAGIGGLIPGYCLLVPRRHVKSTGELSIHELDRVFSAAREIAGKIKDEYGGSTVIVEHGSSGDENLPGGACITHAHIHIFPLDSGTNPRRFIYPHSEPVGDIKQLKHFAARGSNYYYCESPGSTGQLAVDADLGHQYARKIWADSLGKQDRWDWAAVPCMANARLTANQLRRCSADGGSGAEAEIRETITAYDFSAEQYARRTSEFADDSALPSEIDWLISKTTGQVLDAGCGAGRDALRFAASGRAVVALDASKSLLAHVADHPNIRKVWSDVREMPLEAKSVGAIWCSAVLLHMRRDKVLETLKEFARVLTPDGLIEISVKKGEGGVSELLPGDSSNRRHFYFYTNDDLIQLARLGGLQVEREWETGEQDSATDSQTWTKVLLRPDPSASFHHHGS
jgi:ubiquinone/menaquinone biosynthesis C-methylase UbiE/diadenosine tetraphosphate (Ap4A) HIT family hydrolase